MPLVTVQWSLTLLQLLDQDLILRGPLIFLALLAFRVLQVPQALVQQVPQAFKEVQVLLAQLV
jgi:hypothetical protein